MLRDRKLGGLESPLDGVDRQLKVAAIRWLMLK